MKFVALSQGRRPRYSGRTHRAAHDNLPEAGWGGESLGGRTGWRAPRACARSGRGRRLGSLRRRSSREILRDTGGRGVDVAITAAKGGSVNQCLHATRNAGRVVITGIPVEMEVAVEFSPLRRKRLALFTVGAPIRFRSRTRPVVRQSRALRSHRHHVRRWRGLRKPFRRFEHYAGGVGKLIIQPHS